MKKIVTVIACMIVSVSVYGQMGVYAGVNAGYRAFLELGGSPTYGVNGTLFLKGGLAVGMQYDLCSPKGSGTETVNSLSSSNYPSYVDVNYNYATALHSISLRAAYYFKKEDALDEGGFHFLAGLNYTTGKYTITSTEYSEPVNMYNYSSPSVGREGDVIQLNGLHIQLGLGYSIIIAKHFYIDPKLMLNIPTDGFNSREGLAEDGSVYSSAAASLNIGYKFGGN